MERLYDGSPGTPDEPEELREYRKLREVLAQADAPEAPAGFAARIVHQAAEAQSADGFFARFFNSLRPVLLHPATGLAACVVFAVVFLTKDGGEQNALSSSEGENVVSLAELDEVAAPAVEAENEESVKESAFAYDKGRGSADLNTKSASPTGSASYGRRAKLADDSSLKDTVAQPAKKARSKSYDDYMMNAAPSAPPGAVGGLAGSEGTAKLASKTDSDGMKQAVPVSAADMAEATEDEIQAEKRRERSQQATLRSGDQVIALARDGKCGDADNLARSIQKREPAEYKRAMGTAAMERCRQLAREESKAESEAKNKDAAAAKTQPSEANSTTSKKAAAPARKQSKKKQ